MSYYYAIDFDGSGEVRTNSLKEAMEICEEWIENYRGECGDDGWSDGVEQIEIFKCSNVSEHPDEDGILVAKSTKSVLETRPDDVREDGYSESDNYSTYWGEHFTEIVDFAMCEISQTETTN